VLPLTLLEHLTELLLLAEVQPRGLQEKTAEAVFILVAVPLAVQTLVVLVKMAELAGQQPQLLLLVEPQEHLLQTLEVVAEAVLDF
jgi:hypothetical protein